MKKYFWKIILIFLFTFLFSPVAHAQTLNQNWKCLDVTVCPNISNQEQCRFVKDSGILENRYYHSARVNTKSERADKPLPNKKTYIIECVEIMEQIKPLIPQEILDKYQLTPETIPSEVCTSGSSQIDVEELKDVFQGEDKNQLLKDLYGKTTLVEGGNLEDIYQFVGYFEYDLESLLPQTSSHAFITDSNGDFPERQCKDQEGKSFPCREFIYNSDVWIWSEDEGFIPAKHKLMALNLVEDTGAGDSDDITQGNNNTQKQTTFTDFESAAVASDCIAIAWDPYGRVFDSRSLEPIPNVQVRLLKRRDNNNFTTVTAGDVPSRSIKNPQITIENASFSFVVPDGTYKLMASAANYDFPSKLIINPNYKYIYSDIYRAEEIIQKGKMQHRDIPLDSINGTPGYFSPKILGKFVTRKTDGTIAIDGSISHPYGIVKAYCGKGGGNPTTLINSTQADKEGSFKINIDQKKCSAAEMFNVLTVEKVDLTIYPFTKQGQEGLAKLNTSYKMLPIPSYLEGYAYDENKKIIPSASVGVYLFGGTKPYYQTTADEKGYFKIESKHLPLWQYTIRYRSLSGIKTQITTASFITVNNQFISSRKIDLYSPKNLGQNKTTSTSLKENGPKTQINPTSIASSISNIQSNKIFLIVVILIILVIITSIIIGIYVFKQKQTPTNF